MEPMQIPQTSAFARITTISAFCWGAWPVGGIFAECQVTVEGDVYPTEAIDTGDTEP